MADILYPKPVFYNGTRWILSFSGPALLDLLHAVLDTSGFTR